MKKYLVALFLSAAVYAQAAFISTLQFPPSNLSAFGDLVTAGNTPVIQIDFIYGANTQIGTLANTGTGAAASTSSGRLSLVSGTANNGTASYTSVRPAKYRQGQGVVARFTTVFVNSTALNTMRVGMGNTIDGYFVGYNGTAFGICHRINSVDTWTAQASFNGDTINGSGTSGFNIDPTKGNVWMIEYPFLGYGAIKFFVLHPTGYWILVHTIQYPNTTVTLQLTNPNLSFYAQSLNGASGVTSCVLYVGSVGVFVCGERKFLGPAYGTSNRKATITTQTNVLSLRNATTYNTLTNRSMIRIKSISVAWDGANDTCQLNMIKNTTLGGSPSYAAISGSTADSGVTITSGQSVASVDTAGTTITGGIIQFNTSLARNSNVFMDVSLLDLFIEPASTMTFAITGDASGTARISVNWVEDI